MLSVHFTLLKWMEWQHGFVKERSYETQLVLTHRQWSTTLDEGHQVDVSFLDFCEAFDRVSHPLLLQKLSSFSFTMVWKLFEPSPTEGVVLDGVTSSFGQKSHLESQKLSWQPNDAITYFTCSSISRHWELFFQNRSQELFPPIAASMFVKFKRNL